MLCRSMTAVTCLIINGFGSCAARNHYYCLQAELRRAMLLPSNRLLLTCLIIKHFRQLRCQEQLLLLASRIAAGVAAAIQQTPAAKHPCPCSSSLQWSLSDVILAFLTESITSQFIGWGIVFLKNIYKSSSCALRHRRLRAHDRSAEMTSGLQENCHY